MESAQIDRVVFAELQQTTGDEFVGELVETFAEEGPAMIAELRASLSQQSADRFRRSAHSLKTNAQTFGARKLAELARALELGGLPRDDANIDALAGELDRALHSLRELVRG